MIVLKADGREVPFEMTKLSKSITDAMKKGSGIHLPKIANIIVEDFDEKYSKKDKIRSKDIYKFVINKLREYGQNMTAKAYEDFTSTKAYKKCEGIIDNDIKGIIDGSSDEITRENANKDSRLISTQRDLIAGAESRSYAARNIIPTDLYDAHKNGLIHIHDTDYLIHKGMINCLSRDTRFVTSEGIKSFYDFSDGDEVIVPTHLGNWKKGIVKCYGEDIVYEYTIGFNTRTASHKIKATGNHGWFNPKGIKQIGLALGNKILTESKSPIFDYDTATPDEQQWWLYGFVLGDGCTTSYWSHNKKSLTKTLTRVRLCGRKNEYVKRFSDKGYAVSYPKSFKGDANITFKVNEFDKNIFLKTDGWKNLTLSQKIALYNGYLSADGAILKLSGGRITYRNISTSDINLLNMIKDLSDISGYYIQDIVTNDDETNFGKRTNTLYTVNVNDLKHSRYPMKVMSVEKIGIEQVWCLEVEDDNSFILEGGIPTSNCCLINLKDMLDNGTCINGKWIDPPKSFVTACTVATQISLQISNGQYGGQTMSMSHLAPYVRVSYNKHLDELGDLDIPQEEKERKAWELTRKDVKAGVQTIQFQENTFTSNNGQTPFVSLFLYLDEDPEYKKETAMIIDETLNLRMLGMKNKDGVYVTPAFPKLLFVLDEDNVPEDSEYHWLFKKAVDCANRRSNPDFMSAKILKKNFDGNVFPVMGCRSALAAWKTEEGKYKFYGRFNRGVVSLNLVDIALTSGKDEEKFWRILDERLELVKSALLLKDSMIRNATSDVSPIHWQYGGIARLAPGEKINRLLDNGYSSISLGYVGVYEMTKYMTGKSNTDPQGKEFAMRVIDYLENKTIEWRSIPGLHGCSLYGTPAESLAGKFYRKSEERFGKIPDITDKEYFTNSYHVSVREPIDAFSKLSFESEFQGKSKGGAVSYVEIPNMEDNLEALEEIVKHMYETIQYAELNTKAGDVCGKCGFTGTVEITEDGLYKCPKCGNIDQNELWVTRRVCGYLGSTTPCKSRMMDIRDRVEHI